MAFCSCVLSLFVLCTRARYKGCKLSIFNWASINVFLLSVVKLRHRAVLTETLSSSQIRTQVQLKMLPSLLLSHCSLLAPICVLLIGSVFKSPKQPHAYPAHCCLASCHVSVTTLLHCYNIAQQMFEGRCSGASVVAMWLMKPKLFFTPNVALVFSRSFRQCHGNRSISFDV